MRKPNKNARCDAMDKTGVSSRLLQQQLHGMSVTPLDTSRLDASYEAQQQDRLDMQDPLDLLLQEASQ